MLTIRAMAQMGPWLLDRIERLNGRHEHCQRCNTKIKWVWVMEKQNEPKQLWRIGNECGPQLEDMSEELWNTVAKPFEQSINHVRKLDRLAIYERDYPGCRPAGYELGWAAQQVARIAAAGITPHERRVMGSQVSQRQKAYEASIRNVYPAQRKAEARGRVVAVEHRALGVARHRVHLEPADHLAALELVIDAEGCGRQQVLEVSEQAREAVGPGLRAEARAWEPAREHRRVVAMRVDRDAEVTLPAWSE